ncbi:MAG: HNH endonuclease [Janthinobacterium lividum]
MARRLARIPISRVRLAVLYSEQGGCCAGCFKPLGEDVHVDHVVPLAGGGADVFENMQLLHSTCNQAKRAMSAARWFERNWQAFLKTRRAPARQKVTVSFQPELVERLRLAAYWSKRSVTALLEEGAAHSLRAIEEGGGMLQAPDERSRPIGLRGRWVPPGGGLAGSVPPVSTVRNGDLFAD